MVAKVFNLVFEHFSERLNVSLFCKTMLLEVVSSEKEHELVRVVCEIMHQGIVYILCVVFFTPLLACFEARNNAMSAWTMFLLISFQLMVAHLYMFQK